VKSDSFVLIKLEGGESFVFQLFPAEIQTTARVNWEPQDTTIGMKPIFYANRDGIRISVPEVWFDKTDTNESIAPDIDALHALRNENPRTGRPPTLRASWGDEGYRCVLEEVTISRKMFSGDGLPLRASVSLQLLELQNEREDVTSTVTDVPPSGIGPG